MSRIVDLLERIILTHGIIQHLSSRHLPALTKLDGEINEHIDLLRQQQYKKQNSKKKEKMMFPDNQEQWLPKFYYKLQLILIVLKFCKIIEWHWLWVLSPIILAALLTVVIVIFAQKDR